MTADTNTPRDAQAGEAPANEAPTGRYRHYKGGEYVVIGTAIHSETGERLVVYRPEYGERALWVRPLAMFLEPVVVGGETVPRFRRVAEG